MLATMTKISNFSVGKGLRKWRQGGSRVQGQSWLTSNFQVRLDYMKPCQKQASKSNSKPPNQTKHEAESILLLGTQEIRAGHDGSRTCAFEFKAVLHPSDPTSLHEDFLGNNIHERPCVCSKMPGDSSSSVIGSNCLPLWVPFVTASPFQQ